MNDYLNHNQPSVIEEVEIKQMEEHNMAEQNTTQQNWLDEEINAVGKNKEYPKIPAVKFVENQITEIEIDFSKPFEKWNTTDMKGKEVTKAIIPCLINKEARLFWLNLKNPIYKDIIKAGKEGQKVFKILQTGRQENTKYVLVK